MSRQNTDLNYIEVGYFTPEEYYVYTANAESAQTVTATFTCVIGKIQTASSSQTASLTQTATGTRVIEFDCDFGALFSPSMTADAFKNHTAVLDVVSTMTTDAVVNRSAAITLANIINQSSQAVKTVDIQSTQTTAFTQSTNGIIQKSASANLNATSTWSDNAGKLQTVAAAFTTTARVTTTKTFGSGRPRPYTSVGSPQINTSIKKFGAGSARLDGSNYVTVPASPDWSQLQTVDLWFYIDSADIPSGGQHNLLVWGTSLSNFTRIYLESQPAPGAGISSIYIDSNTSLFWSRSYISNRPALNTWHHLRVLDNGSSLTLWLNGSRLTPNSTTYNSAGLAGNRELRLGMLSNLGQRFYLDELLITKQQLTSSSTTSFSVPTDRWRPTDQTPIYLLSHYDTDFSDDTGIWESAQSALSSSATISAVIDGVTKSAQSSLTAQANFTATIQTVKLVDAGLSATATQTATATKVIAFESALPVTATETAVIGVIKQFDSTNLVAFNTGITVNPIIRPLVFFESTASLTATTARTTVANSALAVTATQSTGINYSAGAGSSQNSSLSQTVIGARSRGFDSAISVTTGFSAQATKLPPFSANLEVTATVTADAVKFKRTEAALSVIATQSTLAVKTADSTISVTSTLAQSTDGIRIRFFDSTQTASAQTSILAVKTTDVNSVQSMTASETATVVKTVSPSVANMVLFGSSIDADLTARPMVYLESQAAMTVIIGSIKDTRVGPDIKGIEFNNSGQTGSEILGDNWLYIRDQKFVLDTASTDTFLIAFWAKDPLGVILTTGLDFSQNGGYFKFTANSLIFEGLRGTGFGQINDRYAQTWSGITTTGWHHYVIYQNAAMSTARLYIDGEAQAVPSVINTDDGNSPTFSATKAIGLYRPNNPSGQFVLRWCLGKRIINWYDSVNNLTNVFKSSESFQGSVYQFVAYFDSGTPNGLDQRVINKIYSPVTRNLGTSGTDTGLAQPRLYLRLLDYTDIENRGSLTLENTISNIPDWYTITDLDVLDNLNQSYIQAGDYTESIANNASDLEPGLLIESNLVAGFIGVFLYGANFSALTTQSSSAQRLRGTAINLASTATISVQGTVTAGLNSTVTVSATQSATVSKFTGYFSDLDSTATVTAVIGFNQSVQADLSDQFDFVCDFNALPPTRAEASLSSTSTITVNAQSFTAFTASLDSTSTQTATATVIPPIRAEAAFTVSASLTAVVGSIEQFAVLTMSTGTMTIQPVKTARPVLEFTAQAQVIAQPFKATGGVADLTAFYSTLTVGDIINIDPFLTLTIEPESRLLTVNEESKVLNIEQETRNLIIEGYEQ